MNEKITIKYQQKEYQIEKIETEQKVKPKDNTDQEIIVKNYQEGQWNHTAECSEDGTNFETITIKWGLGKYLTIWGGGSSLLILIGLIIRQFTSSPPESIQKLIKIEKTPEKPAI